MFTIDNPPNQAAYRLAIDAVREALSERELGVLQFQFSQPCRAVTSQDIRDHFG